MGFMDCHSKYDRHGEREHGQGAQKLMEAAQNVQGRTPQKERELGYGVH